MPAPVVVDPRVSGVRRYRDGGLSFGWMVYGLPLIRESELFLQLAEDPHFEQVHSALAVRKLSYSFDTDTLPNDVYFFRIRWQSETAMSPWSDTVSVYLRDEE